MNIPKLKLAVGLPLLAALAAGCATSGVGSGATVSGEDPVNFTWNGTGRTSGTMSATLPDGSSYNGHFFQITDETTVDSIRPLWYGWYSGWARGPYWDSPTPDFITHYSGSVVANLAAPDGTHIRCNFELAHPRDGMSGGGSGQCEMPNGNTIDATFPTT